MPQSQNTTTFSCVEESDQESDHEQEIHCGESEWDTDTAYSDTENEDSDMDCEELENCIVQVGCDGRVTGFIATQMKKRIKCQLCHESVTTTELLPHNFINHSDEPSLDPLLPKLSYPNKHFNAQVIAAVRFVDSKLNAISHHLQLKAELKSLLKERYSLKFGCPEHKEKFTEHLMDRICLNCIFWFTRRENTKLIEQGKPKKKPRKLSTEEKKAATLLRRRQASKRRSLNSYYEDDLIQGKIKK